MSRQRKRAGLGVLIATFALAGLGAVAWGGLATPETAGSAGEPEQAGVTSFHEGEPAALEMLNELEAAQPESLIDEYRRDYFGSGWASIDGCSVRNLVLERDLGDVQWLDDSCVVASGSLSDPYTGQQLDFQHDAIAAASNPGSQGVQIDHVVSLRAAWFGGAYLWTAAERETFANDLENLVAVDGPANNSKNALGPPEWLVPENAAHRCSFAIQYAQVNASWQLGISDADRAALEKQLRRCVNS